MATEAELQLEELINELDLEDVDLVLVEGFRHADFPRIELHRPSMNRDLIFVDDAGVIAVASDEEVATGDLPRLDINRTEDVMQFILKWMS
jgi:molybdopterin-guanine dinucleotide biosynthesis protein MobB